MRRLVLASVCPFYPALSCLPQRSVCTLAVATLLLISLLDVRIIGTRIFLSNLRWGLWFTYALKHSCSHCGAAPDVCTETVRVGWTVGWEKVESRQDRSVVCAEVGLCERAPLEGQQIQRVCLMVCERHGGEHSMRRFKLLKICRM